MKLVKAAFIATALALISGCQTGEALESAVSTSAPAPQDQQIVAIENAELATIQPVQEVAVAEVASQELALSQVPVPTNAPNVEPAVATATQSNTLPGVESTIRTVPNVENTMQLASLSPEPAAPAFDRPRARKTFLINGLLSAVPFVGYGFRNLQKKMPGSEIHSYITPVESATVIMPKVIREIEQAYAADPDVAINLIGISLGADFVTIVAEKLHRKQIPVNYLGIVDGTVLRPITPNVAKADNLTCTYLDCTKAKARLAQGNTVTRFNELKYKSSHIPLGNNAEMHARVIAQSNS